MAEKMYYTMGEVSEMLDVSPSLVRFWERRFDRLTPAKNKKGNRLFTAADVRTLKTIYHLVKERGMTLAGAEKQLKARGGAIDRDMELAERLGAIRALLVEVRGELGGGGVIVDDEVAGEILPTATAAEIPEPVATAEDSATAEGASCPEADFAVVSTASAGAFAASEQEFAAVSDDDDDDPEYDSNPEFDHEPEPEQELEPEPEAVREPEFSWETEPELQPEHEWEPEPEDTLAENPENAPEEDAKQEPAPEKSPYPTELTLF